MAPELFPSVPGGVSGMARKDAEDRVTEKVGVKDGMSVREQISAANKPEKTS